MSEPAGRTDISILDFEGISPRIDPTVFIASGARIIGDVTIGARASVWFNAVLRGDVNSITIGERTNIQDLVMCHVTHRKHALVIGRDVTVGHSAILHGATIGDRVLIGMGATILDRSTIGSDSLVAAGAVVREGFTVPDGVLVAGVPARVIRELTDEERSGVARGAINYESYIGRFRNSGYSW